MNARQRITVLLKDWLVLTQRESHAIQFGRWSELAGIRTAKTIQQQPLTEAVEQWKIENPAEASSHPICDEISRLLALESNHDELLALRKRDVREKILLLEQALYDIRRTLNLVEVEVKSL